MTPPSPAIAGCSTLVDILQWRAAHQPDQRAYTFLSDGETEEQAITYGELDAKARAIGAVLQRLDARGQRALLVYPSGLDYICGFFGGLYGGAINVPAYPPGHHAVKDRYLQRLEEIARDARPRVTLTTAKIRALVEPLLPQLPELRAIRWIATDELPTEDDRAWPGALPRSADLAFLQYTSGSTSIPKGVLVSHGNLMVNAEMYKRGLGLSESTVIVNWMPLFHDFGLIGHVLQAMYLGAPCIILEPVAFVQRPLRWLAAISRHRGTISGAPNFAYELCVRKITPEQRRGLDLSCWDAALNAAEPVRAATLDRFAAAFALCGFRAGALTPVYGLAESTLIVSGGVSRYPRTTCHVISAELAHGRVVDAAADAPDAKAIVACGRALLDQRIVIADPETGASCPADRVGEIWLSGPSTAGGYWNRPEETARTFGARLRDTGEGPFLRTGDLGFVRGEELYITGRHKDLIIIRGSNHHPQDLELTAERAHPALRPGNGAAFRLDVGGEERLGLVHEVAPSFEVSEQVAAEIFEAIRQAFAEEHGVDACAIVLIQAGSICKTTSGKIQRQACRAAYLQDDLRVVAAWREAASSEAAGDAQGAPDATDTHDTHDTHDVPDTHDAHDTNDAHDTHDAHGPAAARLGQASAPRRTAAEIQAWLTASLAAALKLEPAAIRVHAPFARQGLSSMATVGLAGDLAEWLDCPLSPTLLYEYPTIESLAGYLADAQQARPAASHAERRRGEPDEPIAVIGMMCRFPGGARDPEAFWQLLRDGRDAITAVPPERWDVDALYDADPDAAGKLYSRHGGFLDNVDRFDAAFFGIAPREAMTMDPQQRLLLEVSWEALERAGQAPDKLVGSQTGVFVGIGSHDYELLAGGLMGSDSYVGTGNLGSAAAGRLSYVLGLHGPTLAVDTACSSSLVAIHLACQSLRAAECNLALAGGVQLMLTPELTTYLCRVHALSPDGRCKTFDAGANGYVRGEGCGMVVLKRLSDAVRDRDAILAVIRGSAVNHDGRSNGLTAPNGRAQEALLRQALAAARLAPGAVDYVEAHGTGTALGDPIEVRALGAVLGAGRAMTQPLAIGSVKTNIGHLEAAAGVAGLIKVVLALQHGEIPPHLHLEEPNPYIPWATLAAVVPTARTAWPAGGKPRIAGVSSFGVSGTNAHVILEQAPPVAAITATPTTRVEILPLSAHSPAALHALVVAYRDWLTTFRAGVSIAEIAYTASVRRAHHEHRLAVVGQSAQDWVEALEAQPSQLRPEAAPGPRAPRPRVVFVFSGHGSQWVGMGRQLLHDEPVFRAALEACDEVIRREAGWSVLDELAADDGAVTRDLLDSLQPLIFAVQVALAALWRAWGVEPDAVVGHSLGEIAAAHVAGALSLEHAARIICRRSELLMTIKGRGMMALVELSLAEAERAIIGHEDRLSAAVSNSAGSTVLSGTPAAIEAVLATLAARGVGCRRLPWAVAAGHSPQVDALLPALRAALGELAVVDEPQRATGRTAMYSTVTAEPIDAHALDAAYWLRNLREPVRFAQTIRHMVDGGYDVFLEISPHPILVPAIDEALDQAGRSGAALPSLRRNKPERRSLLESLAALYVRGHAPAFEYLHPTGVRCVDLPPYPWQRTRYWFDQAAPGLAAGPRRAVATAARSDSHPLLGRGLTSSVQPDSHFWEQPLALDALPYLSDHRVQGEVIFPAAGYLEMALGAAAEAHGPAPHVLCDVTFDHMLALVPGQPRTVQTVLVEQGAGRSSLQISSNEGTGWVRHATLTTRPADPAELAPHPAGGVATSRGAAAPGELVPRPADVATPRGAAAPGEITSARLRQIQERCPAHVPGAEHHRQMHARGASYGPAFQGTAELWIGAGEALGRVRVPDTLATQTAAYRFHPGLLDACLQTMTGLVPSALPGLGSAAIVLPVRLARLCLHASPGPELWVHARLRPPAEADAGAIAADLVIMDGAANVIAELDGLRVAPLEPRASAGRTPPEAWLYARQWQRWEPASPPPAPEPPPVELPPGAWLVLADHGKTGAALVALLERRGQRCVQVMTGPRNAQIEPGRYQVDPRDPQALANLLSAVFTAFYPCLGVVHLWSLDITPVAATTPRTLEADQALGCLSALHLAQALLAAGWRQLPRLHLVTRGTQAPGASTHGVAVAQAPLWGLGRVIAVEHPDLRCRCVDLGAPDAALDAEQLVAELVRDDREDQVALRGDGRHVARLVATSLAVERAATEPARDRPVRLLIREPGVLERLALYETPRRRPAPGEVEIAVEAAGLNFKDVLSAMGMMPADLVGSEASGPPLGGECAGTIVAIGDDVVGLHVGQQVLAFCVAGGALGSFVTTSATLVAAKPAALSFAEAATIPAVFLTACYALGHAGQLRRGERVLIHAGAGGVGMAAIQYAQHVGAEIFATAGSAEKRDFLRSLGVPHVLDSRSLGFADEVMRITGGEGVDVVLNSLAGDFISHSLGVLRRYGRFVEIGVRDYLENRQLGLRPFLNNLSFALVDLVHLALDKPGLVAELLQQVMRLFAEGALRPLPCRSLPISRATDAFDYMAKARHIGKLALSLRDPDVRIVPAPTEIRADGSYLITGGLGGLGLGLARWLVERGARHLVLAGRSAPSLEAQQVIAAIARTGAEVVTARVDVARHDDLAAVLRDLGQRLPPLRGIIHAAAALDDGTVVELDAARFARPMAPKMLGAWNLHALTLDQPLDFFVLYSSAALLLGSPGQASYVAGNAFLEALARHRRQLGRCAMTIDWGAFSEAGGAAAEAQRRERLAARGLRSLTPAQGHDVLGRLLAHGPAQIGVMDFDAAQWIRSYPSEAGSPFLSELVGRDDASARAPDATGLRASLQTATPEARVALLEGLLAEQLGRVLRLDAAAIGRQAPFPSLGLDSLMGLELRNRLTPLLGQKLSAALLAAHPTISALAAHLGEQLGSDAGGAVRIPDEFHADAVLDPAVCPEVTWRGPDRPVTRVLLTGATGFLGAFLLRELLDQTACEIACLVRAPDEAHGHARLRQALARHELWSPEHGNRITAVIGDLAQPRLGLSEAAFDELASSLDEIYHNGALVDWHEPYASMRAANVMSTQEVLRLGARRRIKPVHYLSSLATLAPLMSAGGVLHETDEPDWQARDFDLLGSGYVQSKWVAERKVLLARDRGYPVAIYRPGFITGDSKHGTWVAPDFLYDLMKGCIQLGVAPAWNASVGMVAADLEARTIVRISRQPGCHGKTLHVVGQLGASRDPELSFAGLWDYIRRRGYPLEVVPQAAFHRALEDAVAAGRGNPLRSYVHHLRTEIFASPRQLEFDCRVARALLGEVEVSPCSATQLLDTYFDQMERSGFLAK